MFFPSKLHSRNHVTNTTCFSTQFAKKHEQNRRQLELQQKELDEKRQRFEKDKEVFQQTQNSVVDGHPMTNQHAK